MSEWARFSRHLVLAQQFSHLMGRWTFFCRASTAGPQRPAELRAARAPAGLRVWVAWARANGRSRHRRLGGM